MAKERLYQKIASQISALIESGHYSVGDKLPDERQMVSDFGVSRGVVRQAKRELQARGQIETLPGAGTFVSAKSLKAWFPKVNAIELTEAREVFEAEVAALAAVKMTDEIIEELEGYIHIMSGEIRSTMTPYQADEAFHHTIAKATKNDTILIIVESLWDMRNSPEKSQNRSQTISDADFNQRIDEHKIILNALRLRDAEGARLAMQLHCEQVKLQFSQGAHSQVRQNAS